MEPGQYAGRGAGAPKLANSSTATIGSAIAPALPAAMLTACLPYQSSKLKTLTHIVFVVRRRHELMDFAPNFPGLI